MLYMQDGRYDTSWLECKYALLILHSMYLMASPMPAH